VRVFAPPVWKSPAIEPANLKAQVETLSFFRANPTAQTCVLAHRGLHCHHENDAISHVGALSGLAGRVVAVESTSASANQPGVKAVATSQPPATNATHRAAATKSSATVEQQIDFAYKALEQGKPDIAIGFVQQSVEEGSGNRRGRFGLSTALIQSNKYKEALAILEAMIKEYPKITCSRTISPG